MRRLRRTFEDLQRLASPGARDRWRRCSRWPARPSGGGAALTAAPAALDELIALGRWLVPAACGEPARGRGLG
jgi:hypothetical protein